MHELEIQVLGMSRSGNHAITDWIYAQAQGPKLLLNCAEGKTNPFLSCRPLDADGYGWRADPAVDIAAERRGEHSPKSLLIHTYEDSPLNHAFSAELERNRQEWLGHSGRRVKLLVLRDPYNLFASRLRMGRDLPRDVARDIWKQHAREALGDTHILSGETRPVLYNCWTCDIDYRESLASFLGLRFSDRGFDNVPSCAGGSSFDGVEFDGSATAMNTDERWAHFAHDPGFRDFFDRETARLAERLFGLSRPDALQSSRSNA